MNIKIITSRDNYNQEEAIKALFSQYEALFLNEGEKRKDIIDAFWLAFKRSEALLLFTIDILLACINDSWQSAQDISPYLKLLSVNELALTGVLDVLQNKEKTWPEYDFSKLITELNQSSLSIQVEDERAIFRQIFYRESNLFREIITKSPAVIERLETKFLKELVLSNSAAVSLLIDKKYCKRFANQLGLEELQTLFSMEVQANNGTQSNLMLSVLKYFAEYQSKTLSLLLKLLGSVNSDIINQVTIEQIKQRIFDCDAALLEFLESYPSFFISFAERFGLSEILEKSETPLKFLDNIIKKNEYIMRWLSDHLLQLTAFLLESKLPVSRKEILLFLNRSQLVNTNKKKVSFSELLQNEVKEMLKNLNLRQYEIKELNALFWLLESKEIRDSLRLDRDTLEFLFSNSLTGRLFEKCIVKDHFAREDFDHYLKLTAQNRQAMESKHPFIYHCLALRASIKNIDSFYTDNINSMGAYLAAISENWPVYKKIIQGAESRRQAQIHPIIQLKFRQDGLTNDQFTRSLIKFLLEGNPSLILDISCLQFFCDIASGKEYISFFAKMQEMFSSIPLEDKKEKLIFIRRQNHFIATILASQYYSVKLSAAINEKNLPFLANCLVKQEFVHWLDCNVLLSCLRTVKQDQLFVMLGKIAMNKTLVIKFLTYHDDSSFYFSRLLSFLNDNQVCEFLFSYFQAEDFLALANTVEVGLIEFLLELKQSKIVSEKLFMALAYSLDQVTIEELILVLFSEAAYINKLVENLTLEGITELLLSPLACRSEKVSNAILKQIDKFPFSISGNYLLTSKLFTRNKYLAEFYFETWGLFQRLNYTPESLLVLLVDNDFDASLLYLLNKPDLYIFKMVKPIIDRLPHNLSQQISDLLDANQPVEIAKDFLPQRLAVDMPPLVHYDEEEVKGKMNQIVSLASPVNYQHKDLFGFGAAFLELMHLELQQDFDAAMEKLDQYTQEGLSFFSIRYLPITLLLSDKFHAFLLRQLKEDPEKLIHYLISFPHTHLDLRNFFNLDQAVQSLALVKILNKTKVLFLSLVYEYVITTGPDSMSDKFIEILAMAAWNYPNQLYQLLEDVDFFNKLYSYLYCSRYLFHKNQQLSHVQLRFLLLASLLHVHHTSEYLDIIVYDLNLYEVSDHPILENTLAHFFPIKTIQKSKNQQLISYFLKLPFYARTLSNHAILRATHFSSELRELLLSYPHLYRKFNREEMEIIIASLLSGEDKKKFVKLLNNSALTRGVLREHPYFEEENRKKSLSLQCDTYRLLFSTLNGSTAPTKIVQPAPLFEWTDLANLLLVNCYLPFLTEFISQKELSPIMLNPKIRAEYIISLALFVLEPVHENELEVILGQINESLEKQTGDTLVAAPTIKEWQLGFDYERLNSLFYQLIQEELSTMTGMRIIPSIEHKELEDQTNLPVALM